jgi:BR serine/threonine kinase
MAAETPRIGNYVLLRTLDQGSTGKVKLAINQETQQEVASNIIVKSVFETKPTLLTKIRREIALMRFVDHPHLLRLLDVLESACHLYLVVEYASHGDLFDFFFSKKTLLFDFSVRLYMVSIISIPWVSALAS